MVRLGGPAHLGVNYREQGLTGLITAPVCTHGEAAWVELRHHLRP